MAPFAHAHHRTISRRGAAVAALSFALTLLPMPGPQAAGPAVAATARVGPFGTATIDGVQAPGEWDAAVAVPFRITMWQPAASGAGADATLFLMNDAKNLYVAVRAAAAYDRLTLSLLFDRDRDGDEEIGDDRLEVELRRTVTAPSPLPLRDQFVGYCGANRCVLDDTLAGSGNPPAGTTDGRAAGAFDLTSGYVELVHPFASPDTGHDLHLTPGAAVGLRVVAGGYGDLAGANGSGTVPVQDCQARPCRSGYADLVIATGRSRISTPQEVVSAIRVEALAVSPSVALPGATLKASFKVVNRSDRTLVVPLDPSGLYLGGWLERWLDRLGPDPSIGARNATGSVKLGTEPIDVLARLGGTSWPPGASITLAGSASEVWTKGHPPGDYRYTVRRYPQPSYGSPAQTSVTQFALRGVTDEWHASVGAGGRNGAATLRAWSTDDGSLGLTLRGLSPRTGYPVTVRSGSCSGPTVASAGTVTANASGAVTKTLTLSRAKTSAILAAAARGRLVLRIGSGSPTRCGTLTSIPIYQASLVWRVQRLPGIENDPQVWPHGAVPGSIAATASGLVVAGYHLKNDCTWEPINRTWSCRPPTRRATAVWTSADGYAWTEQILGADTGPGIVAAGSGRVVVVGNGAAWWSTDGRTWTPSSRAPAGKVERSWGSSSGVVTATGAGFVAIMPTQAGPAGCRSAAWTSADGSSWDQLPYDPDLACLEAGDIVVNSSRVVAVGSDPESNTAAIAISPDRGATWERATIGKFRSTAIRITTVTATAAGYVAYGTLHGGGIGVWTSTEGLTWRAAASVAAFSGRDSSWVADAVAFGPGYVLVGRSEAAADSLDGCVLVSGDGTTLRWAPWPPAIGDATMAAAVSRRDRLFVVGTGGAFFEDPAVPLVWMADLGPLP